MNTTDDQLQPVVEIFQTAVFYNAVSLMIDEALRLGKIETLQSLSTAFEAFLSSLTGDERDAFQSKLNETISQKTDDLHKELSANFNPEELKDVMNTIIKPALDQIAQ